VADYFAGSADGGVDDFCALWGALSLKDAILGNSLVYRLWMAPFAEPKLRPVLSNNDLTTVRRVLDIGCGPGTNTRHFLNCDYLGIDSNEEYISSARRRFGQRFMVADVTTLVLPFDRRFDFVLINSFLHHLDDTQVRRLLSYVADLLSEDGCVHITELVLPDRSSIPRLLARLDRGHYARRLERWQELFNEVFRPVFFWPYSVTGFGVPLWNMVYFKGCARS
jgi:SAM-dependent methyltransferase